MSTFKNSLLTSIVVVLLLNIIDVTARYRCFTNAHCQINQFYTTTTKYCCRGKDSYNGERTCQEDCIGFTCEYNFECGSSIAKCCESKCRDTACEIDLNGGIIAAIIIGIIFVIAIPIAIVVCCCCCGAAAASAASRQPVHGGGVVLTAQPAVTVVTSQSGQTQAPVYPPPSYPATIYPPPSYPPHQNYPPPPQHAAFAYPSKPGQDGGMFAPAPPMQTQGPPPTYTA